MAVESEKSETFFFVAGGVFAAWAIVVGIAGMKSSGFAASRAVGTAVIGVSVLLAGLTMAAVIVVSS